jgi:hypothetical protein
MTLLREMLPFARICPYMKPPPVEITEPLMTQKTLLGVAPLLNATDGVPEMLRQFKKNTKIAFGSPFASKVALTRFGQLLKRP